MAPGAGEGPLFGIKVLDFTQFVNGPACTLAFADQGADVLKVEPANGEGYRQVMSPERWPTMFDGVNRGKRSLTLELKHPESKEVLRRLVNLARVVRESGGFAFMPAQKAGFAPKAVPRCPGSRTPSRSCQVQLCHRHANSSTTTRTVHTSQDLTRHHLLTDLGITKKQVTRRTPPTPPLPHTLVIGSAPGVPRP